MTGIASQPFWLRWTGDAGGRVSHAPDYFARRADGSAVVVDCRPAERRKPRDIEKFEATARACELAGWEYRLAGATDPVVTANLRWLAGLPASAPSGAGDGRGAAAGVRRAGAADGGGGDGGRSGRDAAGAVSSAVAG